MHTQNQFAAYVVSYLPTDNWVIRASRLAACHRQLNWWLNNTNVNITVVAMNYEESEKIQSSRITYVDKPSMLVANARRVAFELFYQTQANFGIMMDDDAILYDQAQHNLGPKLFELQVELEGIDLFFPLNPQKIGFKKLHQEEPLYRDHLVFTRNLDLKGSMFIMRNFRKFGKPELWPNPDFNWQEDTLLAIDAVNLGYTVWQCANLILNEISARSTSHFATDTTSRKQHMAEGNKAIVELGYEGLRMKPNSHLLDRREFLKQRWPVDFVKQAIKY